MGDRGKAETLKAETLKSEIGVGDGVTSFGFALRSRLVFTKTESSASLDRLGASRTGTKPRGLPP